MTDKKDLGAQIEFTASADSLKPGVDAVNKTIASIGATAEYVGNKADASIGKLGGSAEKSAKQIAAATRSISAQADRALASFDAGGSIANRLEINAKRAGANLEKLADKIALVRAAENAAAARIAAKAESGSSAKGAISGQDAASTAFAEAQSRVFLAFKVAEQAAINQAAAAQEREATVIAAVAAASERARAAQQSAYETKVAYIAKVNEEGAALFRTKEAQRQLDAERAGVNAKEAAQLAKVSGDREFIAGIYQKISAEEKLSSEFGKSTAEILRLQAAERGLVNTTDSAIKRYEALAKANKDVADSSARRKASESVLSQINSVAAGINDNGTLKSRSEFLALKAAEAGVSKEAEAALKKIALLDAGTGQLGKSAFATRNRLLTLQYTISDIAASAASGISPLTILLQQGGQVFDAFGGANAGKGNFFKNFLATIAEALTPMRLLIGGVATAVVSLGYSFYRGAQQSKAFADSLVLTGNYAGITEGQFNSLAKSLSASGQISVAAARETAQALLSTGEIGQAQFGKATEAAARYAAATGKTADAVAAEFAGLARDVSAGAETMNRSLHFLTTAQLQQIRLLQDQGKETEAFGIAVDALNNRLKGLEPNLGFIERALRSASHAWSDFWDAAFDIGRAETIDGRLAKAQQALKNAQGAGSLPPIEDPFGLRPDRRAEAVAKAQAAVNDALRAKEKQDGAASADAAIADLDRRASAASKYYRDAEKGAKTEVGLKRELAEEERMYQALLARRATDPNVVLPSAAQRAAVQKRIRDQYTDKSGNAALSEADAQRRANLAKDLAFFRDQLSQEQDALRFNQQFTQGQYQAGLISLDDYYTQRRQITAEGVKDELDALSNSQARIQQELDRGQFKDPHQRTELETQLADSRAAAVRIQTRASYELALATQEQTAAQVQLNDSVQEYRAQLFLMAGDEEQAAKIRTDIAIANARRFAITAGGQVSQEDIARRERQLRIADAFGILLTRNTQLTNAASSAERAYLLVAEQRGDSLSQIESNLFSIRSKAVVQLAEQARIAKALADLNPGNIEYQQRAVDLAQQYAEALNSVDPALNRLRDSAKSTADAITNDIANAINDFKGFRPLLDAIGQDLLRAGTDLLITQPLKVSLQGLFKDIATGDNPLGNLLKGVTGVQGTAAVSAEAAKTAALTAGTTAEIAQTAAVTSSTAALLSLANAAASASVALSGSGSSGSAGGLLGLFGSLFGGSSGIAGNDIGLAFLHSGGIVGTDGSPRTANAAMFVGARRMHSGGIPGLMSGEIPAILRGGPKGQREEVLTASDPRHSDNGGRRLSYAPTFNIPGNVDRRSMAQIEAAAYSGAQRAWARNS